MTEAKRPITIDDLYQIIDVNDPQVSPDGRWVAYVRTSIDKLKNTYQRNIWLAATEGGDPLQLTRSGKDSEPRWSPDGRWLAFTSSRDEKSQIYLLPVTAPGGEARALTSLANGANSPAWSPDGQKIAFLAGMNAEGRAREDKGEELPTPTDDLDAKHRKERRDYDEKKRLDPRVHTQLPYREGTTYVSDHFPQIYALNVHDEKPKPRRLTNLDTTYTAPHWTADGKSLITSRAVDATLDEPMRWRRIYQIDIESLQETKLSDDEHVAFEPLPSPDGKWIAYLRLPVTLAGRANMRLALMPGQGGEARDLTLEFDRSVDTFAWSGDSQHLIFSAPDFGDAPPFSLALADGEIKRLVEGRICVAAGHLGVGANGGIAYATSTPASPTEIYWKAPDDSTPRQLTHHNRDLLEKVTVQESHEIRFPSADGREIQGWYILPVSYEAGKKYPLLLSIHGGPHLMYGPSERSMWHEWQLQAARGYVVLFINARGSDGYGGEFRDSLYGGWGDHDMPDQMAAVDALVENGLVDPEKLFITGGSYGGFMTAWIISHTQRFKAAVAQRGVYYFMSFYGTTDIPRFVANETGMEPWENPHKLWEMSPVAHTSQITTPLLIIHSENDFRVPIVDAELLFALLKRQGKTVKLLRYPNDGHEMSRSGEPAHRISRLNEMMNWFDAYCVPSASQS